MPSQSDNNNFKNLKRGDVPNVVTPPPKLPDDVKRRFPSMVRFEKDFQEWAQKSLGISLQGPQ